MLFGAHESISGGLHLAVERGRRATCDTIQVFNKSNNQWRAKPLATQDVDLFLKAIDDTGVTVSASHTSYLINVCSPKPDLEEKSCAALKIELERCNLLQIPNLVMHPGSHLGTGEELGLEKIAKNISRILAEIPDNSVTLLFEVTAGQGSNLGYKFEHLAWLIEHVDDAEHVGVCLDTCHIFAAGYGLIEPGDYEETIAAFDSTIGLDKMRLIHLNDSRREQGSKIDRHEHIGKGHIGLDGFRNIVTDKRLADIPMIIETPKGKDLVEDIENLKTLRELTA